MVGLVATPEAPAAVTGLFYGGGVDQLWRQAVGAFSVLIVSFVLTLAIGLLLEKTIGFRVSREEELEGIDSVEHAETGYDLNPLGSIGRGATFGSAHRTDEDEAANSDQEVTA
jgi:Amt family ammonium transporter